MPAMKIAAFGGMIPAQDELLLPENNAVQSTDIWVSSGALEGIWQPQLLYTAQNENTRRIFRIPTNYYTKEHLEDAFFMEFTDQYTTVLHGRVINDQYDRYYWCAPTIKPTYNTKDRIVAGQSPFLLGVPAPTIKPDITIAANEGLPLTAATYGVTGYGARMWVVRVGGVVDTDTGIMTPAPPLVTLPAGVAPLTEVRAYVYTWVSAYGEEGPPSPPSDVITGNQLANWRVGMTPPDGSVTMGRNLTTTRIYRTVTAADGTGAFYLVDEVPISTALYIDTKSDTDIAGGTQLHSGGWTPPPDDLEGWIDMPNGMIAGWRKNEVWFCEPYRPHAWPAAYTILTQHPIVGMGIVNATLIITTVSEPYAASGNTPGSVSMVKIDAIEPNLSRASIVSTPDGVFYASPNGLVVASPMYGVVKNVSDKLITKNEWLNIFDMPKLNAGRLGDQYLGFGTLTDGVFQPDAFQNDAFEQLDYTDSQTGFMISPNDGRVAMTMLTSDSPTSSVSNDVWTGELLLQQGLNFYWLNQANNSPRRPYKWTSKKYQFGDRRNLEAMKVFFTIPSGVNPPYLPRNTDINMAFDDQMYGVLRLYVNNKLFMAREIRQPGEFWRIPSGFKGEFWQLEVEARVTIKNIQLANTAKELENV